MFRSPFSTFCTARVICRKAGPKLMLSSTVRLCGNLWAPHLPPCALRQPFDDRRSNLLHRQVTLRRVASTSMEISSPRRADHRGRACQRALSWSLWSYAIILALVGVSAGIHPVPHTHLTCWREVSGVGSSSWRAASSLPSRPDLNCGNAWTDIRMAEFIESRSCRAEQHPSRAATSSAPEGHTCLASD